MKDSRNKERQRETTEYFTFFDKTHVLPRVCLHPGNAPVHFATKLRFSNLTGSFWGLSASDKRCKGLCTQ